jgi:hypothetical protein
MCVTSVAYAYQIVLKNCLVTTNQVFVACHYYQEPGCAVSLRKGIATCLIILWNLLDIA